jgi:hypothetical protein
MEEARSKHRIIRYVAAVILPLLFFPYLMSVNMRYSLNDPDIWWHLKTGEYIYRAGKIPDADPFAYTSPVPLNEGQKTGLRAHWLGQTLYYLSFKAGKLTGVVLLRNFLIVLPMIIVYVWLIRRQAAFLPTFAVIGLPALLFSVQLFYAFERPQGFSFSLALLVVVLLEALKKRTRAPGMGASFFLLPLVTALWANIHAGFIVGNMTIAIYMASEALRALWRKYRDTEPAFSVCPAFFLVCLAAILTSFINPNTYKLFYSYFTGLAGMFISDAARTVSGGSGGSWVREIVLEYKPLYYFYVNLGYKWLILYWIFTCLLFILMFFKYWMRRAVDVAELLTVCFFVVFANMYARGLMFSVAVMPFFFGKTLLELRDMGPRVRSMLLVGIVSMLILTLTFCGYSYRRSPKLLTPGFARSWVTPWFPTKLVAFLLKNRIDPPMYNYYTWGGFLIWTLYPEYRVFIDGRAIDNWANRVADSILKVFPGWQNKLDAYHINFVVVPTVFRETGHILPLAANLARNDNWELIFISNNSVIFVRNVEKNRDLIAKYRLDKRLVFQEIVKVENIFLGANPTNLIFNLAKADALMALERFEEAKAIYERFPAQSRNQLEYLRQRGH